MACLLSASSHDPAVAETHFQPSGDLPPLWGGLERGSQHLQTAGQVESAPTQARGLCQALRRHTDSTALPPSCRQTPSPPSFRL